MKPRMALRKNPDETLDDVVVENVRMFRMEQMDDTNWWLCCYLENGDSVTFWVGKRGRGVVAEATDVPDYEDWDLVPR